MSKTKSPIDPDELLRAVEESTFGLASTGFCLECGEEHQGCEPDARNYLCDNCGETKVFGAMECLLMGHA